MLKKCSHCCRSPENLVDNFINAVKQYTLLFETMAGDFIILWIKFKTSVSVLLKLVQE